MAPHQTLNDNNENPVTAERVMVSRKIPCTWKQLLQTAQQLPDADSSGRIRMPVPVISSSKNFGSARAREDWSARLLELMLSR